MKAIIAINTEAEYKAALQKIEELILSNPKEGATVYDELDTLGEGIANPF
jgi:antitoxin component HigA of HigAB toxin-antitoxin module